MQTTEVPGRVHVSRATMERTADTFEFEHRVVEVKGLGRLDTYLLVD